MKSWLAELTARVRIPQSPNFILTDLSLGHNVVKRKQTL